MYIINTNNWLKINKVNWPKSSSGALVADNIYYVYKSKELFTLTKSNKCCNLTRWFEGAYILLISKVLYDVKFKKINLTFKEFIK